MPQDLARFTNLSPNSLVLIDATNAFVNWDNVTGNIHAWMVAVGSVCPEHCEKVDLEKGDIILLLGRARMIIADTLRHQAQAERLSVPFVLASEHGTESVVSKVDEKWYG